MAIEEAGYATYSGGFGSQWLPAGSSSGLFVALPSLLAGIFMAILRRPVDALSLITRLILVRREVALGKVTNQIVGAMEIEVGIRVEVEERTLVCTGGID